MLPATSQGKRKKGDVAADQALTSDISNQMKGEEPKGDGLVSPERSS